MFPGFPGGYNFILIMDIPCAGAGDAPALFLSGKLKEEDGGIDYSFGEFQGSDIAVMIPKAIDFCFGGKDMGYMLLESEEKGACFIWQCTGKDAILKTRAASVRRHYAMHMQAAICGDGAVWT